jgi:SAM-dependent methyltransferase
MKKSNSKKSEKETSVSKSERIRISYNNSAKNYDSRYESIQFVKYALLSPKIITMCKGRKIQSFSIMDPFLDVGGGGGLLLKFLILFQRYLSETNKFLNRKYQNLNNDIVEKFEESQIFLFEYMKQQLNLPGNEIRRYVLNLPAVVVCDISFEMLQQIDSIDLFINNKNQNSLSSSLLYGKVECDAMYLPLRDNQFSTTTAFTVIQNLEDPIKGFEEMNRVSMKDAHLLISVLQKFGTKIQVIELLTHLKRDFRSIVFDDDWIDKLMELKRQLEMKYQIYFDKDPLNEFQNSEDYLFWI